MVKIIHDDWEKRRLAIVKRWNKLNAEGKHGKPQQWTLQHYLLEWHEPEWKLQPLHCPFKSIEDRLRYAVEHEWNKVALHTQRLAFIFERASAC